MSRGGGRRLPVDELLAPLLAGAPGASGVALAAIHGTGRTLLCGGRESRGGPPTTAETRFEIGSVTKTFTALLLAEMVAAGDVGYDDPIDAYLPGMAASRGDRRDPVTLVELATHTSGLPRLPPGLLRRGLPWWWSNPYATFTEQQLRRSATRCRGARPGLAPVRYSNFGVGLLGHVLATATGTGYPGLLAARILGPLGLHHTTCDPALPQATGYFHGLARPPWRIPGLPAAGALRSTAADLLGYLQAHLSPAATPLAGPLADVMRPRVTLPGSTDRLGLIWNLRRYETHDLLFHSGVTRGFTAFVGFSPQARCGLAALANTTVTLRSHFIQDAYTALRSLIGRS